MSDISVRKNKTGFSSLTYTDVANYLGVSLSSAEQTLITTLIEQVEDLLVTETRRQFFISTTDNFYQEFDGGKSCYWFEAFPVNEVTKIIVDGVTKYEKGGSNNTYTLNVDFFVYPNKIEFEVDTSGSQYSHKNLIIHYNLEQFWGNTVKQAILQYVADLFSKREYAGQTPNSINAQGFSINFGDAKSVPDTFKRLVNMYKVPLL